MIKAWYGPGGSFVTDEPVEGLTHLLPLSPDSAEYYGGKYFIAETISETAVKCICDVFGLEYAGTTAEKKEQASNG